MKAEKLPSGKYRVRAYYTVNGEKHCKSFTSDTPHKAELQALKFLEQYKYNNEPTNITVGNAISQYIEIKEGLLSPTTITAYRRYQKNYFVDIQQTKALSLTHIELQKAINKESKRGISAKTIKNAFSLLTSSLDTICNVRFNQKITLPKTQKKIIQVSEDVYSQIMYAVKGTNIELPVLIALTMGLRISEILGLKWEDYSNHTFYIHRVKVLSDNEYIEREMTKTDAGTRIVTVNPYIEEVLLKMPRNNEYIITDSGKTIYDRFVRIQKEKNLPKMSFHFLRHLNATAMLGLGISDKYAMARGGWSSNSVYKNTYVHTIQEERANVDKKINDFFIEKLSRHGSRHGN